MRRNFGAALAGMAAFTRAAATKSNVDTTLLKSAKLELRAPHVDLEGLDKETSAL